MTSAGMAHRAGQRQAGQGATRRVRPCAAARQPALLLAAAAFAAGCPDERLARDAGPTSLADLAAHRGTVTLTRGGRAAPAQKGPLFARDFLETGGDGSATVAFAGGRTVEMGPNSALSLSAGDEGVIQLKMDKGAVITREAAAPGPGGVKLAILTPFGITRVPADKAEVELDVGEKGATLKVHLGQVTFYAQDGTAHTATSGEVVRVKLGEVTIERVPAAPERQPLEVVLTGPPGAAEIRAPPNGPWRPAAAREVVPAGARFRTGRKPGATLAVAALRGRLDPGSSGSLADAFREGGEVRLEVGLDKGGVELLTPPGGPRTVIAVAGARPATIAVTGESQLRLRAQARALGLEAVTGECDLDAGGAKAAVKAGHRADVGPKGAVKVTPVPRSPLSLPSGRRTRLVSDAPLEVAASWPQQADAWRRIELARDAAFKEVLIAGPVGRGFVNAPVTVGGEIHWRVFDGARGGGAPVARGSAAVEPDAGRSSLDLEHTQNDVLDNGLKTTVFFQSAVPTLTFVYPARPNAASYRVRVYTAANLTRPLIDETVPSVRYELAAGRLGEGNYAWYASPLDAAGNEVEGGRMNKLEISYDNSLPTLLIGRPRPGERVRGAEVEASGVAPLGSRVFVNGQAAPLDEKGRFKVRVKVGRGGLVVFKQADGDGAETLWIRGLEARGVARGPRPVQR